MLIHRALIVLSILSSAALLRADFSGDFAVGTPGNYSLLADPTPTFGNWIASYNSSGGPSGGEGTINTSGAPGAVEVAAIGYPFGGTGTVGFSYGGFTTDGVVSFNLAGLLSVNLDGAPITSGDGSYSFSVTSGQTLSFGVSATGTFQTFIPNPSGPPTIIDAQTVTRSGIISDFNFTAIPEPSAYAIVAGACALGLSLSRRRRRD